MSPSLASCFPVYALLLATYRQLAVKSLMMMAIFLPVIDFSGQKT